MITIVVHEHGQPFQVYEVSKDDIVEWKTVKGIRRGRVLIATESDAAGKRSRPIIAQLIDGDNKPCGNNFGLGRFSICAVYDPKGQRKKPMK